MTKAGIYTITYIQTGQTYVGQSLNCPKRFAEHQRNLNRRTHHNDDLQRLWDTGGLDVFEFKQVYVLDKELSPLKKQIHLTEKELDYWWHYKSQGKSLNKIAPEIHMTTHAAVEYKGWKKEINRKITNSLNGVNRNLETIRDSAEPLISVLDDKRSRLRNIEQLINRNVGWRRFFLRQREDPPVEELQELAARLQEQICAIRPVCDRAVGAIRELEARKAKLYRSYPGNIERSIKHADRFLEMEKKKIVLNIFYGFGIFYELSRRHERQDL